MVCWATFLGSQLGISSQCILERIDFLSDSLEAVAAVGCVLLAVDRIKLTIRRLWMYTEQTRQVHHNPRGVTR